MSDDLGVEPPHDILAEQAVLGGMMGTTSAIPLATDLLTGQDFYRPAHGYVFGTILALADRGIEANVITVCDELRRTGELKRCGGELGILTIQEASTGILPANIPHYASIVIDHSVARRLLQASQRIAQLTRIDRDTLNAADLMERARAEIDDATNEHRHREGTTGIDLADAIAVRLDDYTKPTPPGLPTGWREIDGALGAGLRPGTLTIVGARTGNGKSIFTIALAVSAARRGIGTLFASVEMNRNEIVDRILADIAGIDSLDLAMHRISDTEWSRLHSARHRLRDAALRIEDTPSLSTTRLRSLARDRARRKPGLGLIVVDYVQLMRPGDERVPRQEQVAAISRALKMLAGEFDVPVVAAAQVNREAEKRLTGRPRISDLRESGALEQDSDYVILLHREPDNPDELLIDLAKNRHGPTITALVPLQAKYSRIGRHLEAI
jgi:replicative DNA helicase